MRAADLRLCQHDLTAEQETAISAFENTAIEHTATAAQLNSLEQSDREELVATWLEEHGIGDPWKLSANLVEAGIDAAACSGFRRSLENDGICRRAGASQRATRGGETCE